ncbi:DMT family transporter [Desulfotalea psychrophila]|uniref:Conserved hypothetical membrane protein n=1 Tax=Desulfotalea psychrophila (strain LSv54 / DSM 12343) TaxID=177439 RepID=Q6AQH3_DESPS|nr:DMT family transporter [Desulfotalea psychrophila]CAG35400.1 conserved hypothetical membrane protein [Desulfotalea psychrophila LSv54]
MSRLQANLLLSLAALIWGSSFVVQQIGTGNLDAASFTGARFLLGSLVVLPFALRQFLHVQREVRAFTLRDGLGIALTGSVLCVAAALQQYGILRTTVTNSGFLTALYVPMVPILALLVFRKKPHWSAWPASICCFVGTYIMSGAQNVVLASGDLWVISSTIFWASHVLLIGIMVQKTEAPLVVACGQFFICGILGLFLGQYLESPDLNVFAGALTGILCMGFFSVALAFTFQVIGQRYTPAPDAAIILSSETVFAALCGAIFLGERVSDFQLAGGLLIFGGIIAVEILPMLKTARILS